MTTKKYIFTITTNRYLGFDWQVSFDSLPTLDQLLNKLADYIIKDVKKHFGVKLGSTKMWWVTEPDSLNISMCVDGKLSDLCDDELSDYLLEQEGVV
tara:strand:+ start:174 stop:464 length:291 start_codon:yes stop_codon:yes gene_type:complete